MSGKHEVPRPEKSESLSSVDGIADDFEASWRKGETPPEIRSFLDRTDGEKRAQLLLELIKLDMECRAKYAEPKPLDEYLEEWPELKGEDGELPKELVETSNSIRNHYGDTLRLSQMGDPLQGAQVRCPYCAALVEVPDGAAEAEKLSCASCSSPFRWEPVTTRGTDPVSLPDAIGKYEIIEVLGRGAFGLVYKARDWELGRTVAIKMPRSGDFSSEEEQQRFLREARSAASLDHPGVVKVHEISHESATTCIVSEFIDGLSLAEVLSGPRLSYQRVAEVIAGVAEALDHAHQHGVIHRDIKPGNILMDSDGKPHLADFGLARNEDEDITVTQSGQILGTPAYMSPEQAEGDQETVGPPTDIYSLGAMLYEMLTGSFPFQGSKRMLLYQVIHEDPIPPRRINDHIPRDLEVICLKALSKETQKRYTTAGAMTADLRRWLQNEPILARPVSTTERFMRWSKRNPTIAVLGATIFLLLIAIAVGATIAAVKINKARLETEEALVQVKLAQGQQRKDALKASEALAMEAVRAADELRWGEAEIRADATQRLVPDGPWGEYALGMLASKRNQLDSAKAHFEEALNRDSDHQPSKDGLAHVLVRSGQLKEAAALIEEAANPRDWQTVKAAGHKLFQAERYRPAEKAFAKALDLLSKVQTPAGEQEDWGKLLARADGFLASERFPEAKAMLEKAIEILKSEGGTAPGPLNKAKQKLRLAEKELESLKRDLEYARDDANAWVKCEGFEGSLRGLSAEAQWQRVQEKMEELHGQPIKGRGDIKEGKVWRVTFAGNSSLRYLHPLKELPLTVLLSYSTSVSDLSPLRGMPLTHLNIGRSPVSELASLEGMPLELLKIDFTKVTDLLPLKGMALKIFTCNYTPVSNLAPLQGMPLEILGLTHSKVRDLAPLHGMPLKTLLFNNTKVSDLSPLKGMALTYLLCSSTNVNDVSPIVGMPLETLVCSDMQGEGVGDLAFLQGMPLKSLSASGSFSDLSPLKGMPLRRLEMSSPNVYDLSPLQGMPLEYLSIYSTKVKDLSPLKGMPLHSLFCHSLEIEDFSPLKGMKLRLFTCGKAALRNWDIFREMPLEDLSIFSDPYLADLSVLKGMKLRRLRCGMRNLKDLSPLNGIPLTDLDIDNTQVSDLTPLKGMPLKELHISHTPAADLTPLEGMKLKEFHPPPKDLLTPASLKLIEKLKKRGCNVVWK